MNGVELAACTKLNYETLKKYLDGTNDIPEKKLKIIADALGVSVDYLEGKIELKDVDSEYISKKTGFSEETINYITMLKEAVDNILKDNDSEYGLIYKYYSIVYDIVGDIGFLETIIGEINRIIKYYTDEEYEKQFDDVNNNIMFGDKSDAIVIPSSKTSIESFCHNIVSEKLCDVFDEKIKKIIEDSKK